MISVSGGKIWDIGRNAEKNLCLIRILSGGDSFEIIYGYDEFGTVPTTELLNHILAHAINVKSGLKTSFVVHAHIQNLIDLTRHKMCGDYSSFNRTIYSQRVELIANIPELIGYIPLASPGSIELAATTLNQIKTHRAIAWAFHGIFVREKSYERCLDLIEYIECSASAALRNFLLNEDLLSFPKEFILDFVSRHNLKTNITSILEQKNDKVDFEK